MLLFTPLRRKSLNVIRRTVHAEARLNELGIELPKTNAPAGNYVQVTSLNNLRYTAGQLPVKHDGSLHIGKLGRDVSIEEGQLAARRCAIQMMANLKNDIGSLDRVRRILKVVGFVNCTDSFTDQPSVINGCSDLLGEVFGECGIHSRSAVGCNSLPLGVSVEIEFIVEIDD